MTCSECHEDNRESAKFCGSCGARLPGQCPACGKVVRASAKFCDECGHELSAPPVVGAPAASGAAVNVAGPRSEEHTSELQSRLHLVCRLLLEKKKTNVNERTSKHSKVMVVSS